MSVRRTLSLHAGGPGAIPKDVWEGLAAGTRVLEARGIPGSGNRMMSKLRVKCECLAGCFGEGVAIGHHKGRSSVG